MGNRHCLCMSTTLGKYLDNITDLGPSMWHQVACVETKSLVFVEFGLN